MGDPGKEVNCLALEYLHASVIMREMQVIPGLHTQWLVTQSTALHASETPVTSVFILPRTWRSPKHHAVGT